MMNLQVAHNAGFCFGVQRAVDIAFKLGLENPNQVFTFGPIIHNPQVVEKLEAISVKMIQTLDDVTSGIMIVRSHGLTPDIIESAKQRGFTVIDATCPFVKKVQTYALSLKKEGYPLLLIGDKGHPEVLAIKGYMNNDIMICSTKEELDLIKLPKKIGVVAQTTQDYRNFNDIIFQLLNKCSAKEIKIYNTICHSTIMRQKSALRLAQKVDSMIVIGGKNSANTNRLFSICQSVNQKALLIETEQELEKHFFKNVSKVGITAGASTPKWIINEVIEKVKSFNVVNLN